MRAAADLALEERFVEVEDGRVHVVECGTGRPVVLLHQTPRSWDEYRDVLPLLGARFRAIAIDQLGFGDSPAPPWEPTVERYAAVVAAVLEQLGIGRADVVGHHTGAVVALELAAARPELVRRLVLSSCPLADDEFRRAHAGGGPVDRDLTPAGLRAGRVPFYPPSRPDLLDRFVADALRAGEHAQLGHRAVGRYRMEERLPLVAAPVLVITATDDPFAYPHARPLAEALGGAAVVELAGGTVPLPDHLPEAFATAVAEFLCGAPS